MALRVLKSLAKVRGITGSAVFDVSGQCHAHMLEPPYEPVLFQEVLPHFETLIDQSSAIGESSRTHTFAAEFDNGWLILKVAEDLILMVVADEQAKIAHLAVAINAAFLKLGRVINEGESFTSMQSFSQSYKGGQSSFGGAGMTRPPNRRQSFPQPPAMSMSLSQQSNQPVPKDAVGVGLVRHIVKAFAKFAGQHTKPILQEEFARLGVTAHTLKSGQVADLIKALAKRLPNPDLSDQFMNMALGDAQ